MLTDIIFDGCYSVFSYRENVNPKEDKQKHTELTSDWLKNNIILSKCKMCLWPGDFYHHWLISTIAMASWFSDTCFWFSDACVHVVLFSLMTNK